MIPLDKQLIFKKKINQLKCCVYFYNLIKTYSLDSFNSWMLKFQENSVILQNVKLLWGTDLKHALYKNENQ